MVIRITFFSLDIPYSLETLNKNDIPFGRGAMVFLSEKEDLKLFLTFSPKVLQDNHGTNIRASRKRSDRIVIFKSVLLE